MHVLTHTGKRLLARRYAAAILKARRSLAPSSALCVRPTSSIASVNTHIAPCIDSNISMITKDVVRIVRDHNSSDAAIDMIYTRAITKGLADISEGDIKVLLGTSIILQ
jgi:hypothetical protein